jgi:hypothetical protein
MSAIHMSNRSSRDFSVLSVARLHSCLKMFNPVEQNPALMSGLALQEPLGDLGEFR